MKNLLAILITALIVFGLGWSIYEFGILLTIVGLILGAGSVFVIGLLYIWVGGLIEIITNSWK